MTKWTNRRPEMSLIVMFVFGVGSFSYRHSKGLSVCLTANCCEESFVGSLTKSQNFIWLWSVRKQSVWQDILSMLVGRNIEPTDR